METLFRNSRIKLSQGLLFWREVGTGAPIIFLHGTWTDSSQWVKVMEILSREFHCFAPDLLGFGESEFPNIHYSVNLQVELINEFLDALKLERVYLVGHSLGGWIAATHALKYPERVSKLILISPEGVGIEGIESHWQRMRNILMRSDFTFGLLRLIRPLAKLFGWKINVEADLKLRQIMEGSPTACELIFNRQNAEIKAELLDNRLYGMMPPTLILQGGEDSQEAVTKSKIYTQSIHGAKLQFMAHAGHDLPETSVLDVAGEIRNFLRE